MSYTTRCPACGTIFKVVPDQLKISDGWVRCGHCADVFDATLYLDNWATADTPATVAVEVPDEHRIKAVGKAQAPSASPWPFDDDSPGEPLSDLVSLNDVKAAESMPLPDRVSGALAQALAVPSRETSPMGPSAAVVRDISPVQAELNAATEKPAVRPARGVTQDFHAELLQFASSTGAPDTTGFDAVDVSIGLPLHAEEPQTLASKAEVTPRASPEWDAPDEKAPEPVPQFVRQAQRKAFWRKPLVRVMLSLLAVFLSALLLAQWAHHERHRVLAWQPKLEPVLRWMCSPPACDIGPVRRIDDIVIDSAALVRRLGNFYAFDIVLKNRSDVPLAVPALELTLTDTRDQTVARRVFLPSEWPEQHVAVPARGSIAVSLRLSIELGDAVPMAGYRAFVFYP